MQNQSKLLNLSKSTSLKILKSLSIQNTTKTTVLHLEMTETKIVDTITVIGMTEGTIAETIITEATTVMAIKVEGTTTAEEGTTIVVVMIEEEETGSRTQSVTPTETLEIRKWKTLVKLPGSDAIMVAKTEEIETQVADQDLDPETTTAVTIIEATIVTHAETTIAVAEMTSTVGVEDAAEVGVAIDSRWKSRAAISLEAMVGETSATTTETLVETTIKRADTTTEMTGTISQDIEAHPNIPFEFARAAEEAVARTTSKMKTKVKSLNKANEKLDNKSIIIKCFFP